LSSALPLINIYVYTKFNFNPFSTFQDMAWTGIYGYGEITQYILRVGL